MKYRLSVVPALEKTIEFKEFFFDSRVEVLAAKNAVADTLLFIQDELKAMHQYSNIITAEVKVNGGWEEIKE